MALDRIGKEAFERCGDGIGGRRHDDAGFAEQGALVTDAAGAVARVDEGDYRLAEAEGLDGSNE
jgi:hypothetical protein